MAASLPYLPAAEQQALLDGPALAPPAGVVSNFDNPVNNNALAEGIIPACITVATLCLIARLYTKLFCARHFKLEDYLTCAAYGTYVGWAWCSYQLVDSPGYFVHQWDIKLRDMIHIAYVVHIAGVLYSVTLPLLKCAIMVEWIRMFVPGGTRNAFWWVCVTVITVQIMFGIASVTALCFTCIPYEKIWNFLLPGKCLRKANIEISSATVHLACDAVILCLPHKVIWGLHMSFKKKLGVAIVFSLGILAVVSAAFRLTVTIFYDDATDTVYTIGPVIFWAFAEMTCGFVVICMPAVPKLLMDTGIGKKIKKSIKSCLGMKNTTTSATNPIATFGSQPISKRQNTSNSYRKMDEFDMPLEDLKLSASESTEYLRNGHHKTNSTSIVRTTEITVTSKDFTGKTDADRDQFEREIPWRSKNKF